MSKKRIHELAKEYGMSGKELAAKLRDLGFTQIRSHMTALDEFEELQVQGVLEAHGFVQGSIADSSLDAELGAGLIRRKKKKKSAVTEKVSSGGDATVITQVAPESAVDEAAPEGETISEAQDTAAMSGEAVETPPAPKSPEAEETVSEQSVRATETEETEVEPSTEAPGATASPAHQKTVEVVPTAEQTSGLETSEPALAEEEFKDQTGEDGPSAQAPAASPDRTGEQATEAALKSGISADDSAAPGDKNLGPAGKVVGFIDLSKIQAAPKQSESRRLRSRDDVLPDVRPTLRHDSRNNMLRGDRGSRNSLTAAQLREREAGRYKRHQRGPGTRGGGRTERGAPDRTGRVVTDGSPFAGQTIKIELPVTIKKLAVAMSLKGNQLLKTAWKELGFGTVTITSSIDQDTAELLAHEYEVNLDFIREIEAEEALIESLKAEREAIEEGQLSRRNPTVAFLGHVDHGKTTLIDKIRDSAVADGEHGGITQHIGAYRVTTELGHHVTIIDTPGHAAFTGMRARGANAVDVVVLVVAADAGVQPQTEEAVAHARAAEVPIIVALNKIDRPEANPQRALEQLSGIDVITEEWGGQVAVMPVSGITGEGIQDLLERIFLESEILELDCHPTGVASGIVLEAEVQQGRGIVAHLLVQDGTLNRGDVILAGEGYGKVRSIHNDFGKEIEAGGPSVPVEVSGLSALPGIGEPFHVVGKLESAKEVAQERARKNRVASMAESRKLDNDILLEKAVGPGVDQVNLIIRADVQGTVEVLKNSIQVPIHDEVEARVLQAGVGAVTENDILLASTSKAMVIAFNVSTGTKARQAAEREDVDIRNFNILYNVIDAVHAIMEGRLAPEITEEITGHVEIRRLFRSSKVGNIAGCYVLDGTISRDSHIRLLRDDTVIHRGVLSSLKREADDAKEVREGFECGLVVRNYNDIQEGDIIESFKVIETKRTLESPTRST